MTMRPAGSRRVAEVLAPGATGTDLTLSGLGKASRLWATDDGSAAAPGVAIGAAGNSGLAMSGANLLNFVAAATIALQSGFGSNGFGGSVAVPTLVIQTDLAAALTGNVNDWAPAGFSSGVGVIRMTGVVACNITGLTTGADGRVVILVNSTTQIQSLTAEDALSAAANRFAQSATALLAKAIPVGGMAVCWYDATASRWRVL